MQVEAPVPLGRQEVELTAFRMSTDAVEQIADVRLRDHVDVGRHRHLRDAGDANLERELACFHRRRASATIVAFFGAWTSSLARCQVSLPSAHRTRYHSDAERLGSWSEACASFATDDLSLLAG